MTVVVVEREFKRIKWPASVLIIQPPNGKTLINFETNFYTENSEPIVKPVTLLKRFRVEIEATPARYLWKYGDGIEEWGEEPGAAYPDLTVTHNYTEKGEYAPSVDTLYTGRYRVNGGPWQTIPDTLTVPGATVALRAVEARPVLTG